MTWWARALIIWASLASVAVVALTVRRCEHVEWREATLTAMDGLSDEEAERIERLVRDKRLLPRVQTALRQVVAKAPHRFQKASQA